jgi:hypothetical protein
MGLGDVWHFHSGDREMHRTARTNCNRVGGQNGPSTVECFFRTLEDGSTFVRTTNSGFFGNGDELLSQPPIRLRVFPGPRGPPGAHGTQHPAESRRRSLPQRHRRTLTPLPAAIARALFFFDGYLLDEGPIGTSLELMHYRNVRSRSHARAISGGASHPAKTSLLRHVGLFLPLSLTGG